MEIEINNKKQVAKEGETIIQLADRLGIHIPRFCYHKHLSVVASCRMCLVEIKGMKFAQPACSTKVMDNMKIFTNSEKTKKAQKSTMEFLLINHPLDCPICDQGGECELQDVSLDYGDGHSKYTQIKRVILDRDISPLVSTDMTRCIHCSRCVRFGEEISLNKELGLLDRGEDMKIDTFINQGIKSELSGNMIDLCPVGALNNKPYRYSARTWDLIQNPGISPHDCIGSNIYYHTYKNKIVRAIPKENESINQTWISDRDRFGFEGIYSDERVNTPLIRENKILKECDWDTAYEAINKKLENLNKEKNNKDLGCFISPQSTCEELFLFQKLFKGLGFYNIDHRTYEKDFEYQEKFQTMPYLNCNLNDLKNFDNIILIGVNIKKEFPILSVRFTEAKNNNTKIHSINYGFSTENFALDTNLTLNPFDLVSFLNNLARNNKILEENNLVMEMITNIKSTKKNLIIVGPGISQFSNQSNILASIKKLSIAYDLPIGFLTSHCNSTSSWLFGLLPHRNILGKSSKNKGLNAYEMIKSCLPAYIFYNLEPENDFWNNILVKKALQKSNFNTFFSPFITPAIQEYADLVLPITTFAESSGSYINITGMHQSFEQIVKPLGDTKSGWMVLNEIINNFNLGDYNFFELKSEIEKIIVDLDLNKNSLTYNNIKTSEPIKLTNFFKITNKGLYETDFLVRRSPSLQKTDDGLNNNISLSGDIAEKLSSGEFMEIVDNDSKLKTNSYQLNLSLPKGTIVFPSNTHKGSLIGSMSGYIKVR